MYTIKLKSGRRRFPELIWLGLIIAGLFLFLYIGTSLAEYLQKDNLCSGKLLCKYEDRIADGDKISIDRNFLIQFDSLEKSRVIKVDSSTYVSKIMGDRVKMNLSNQYLHKSGFLEFLMGASILIFVCLIALFLIFLFINIKHIFIDYEIISLKKLRYRKIVDPLGEENWDDD